MVRPNSTGQDDSNESRVEPPLIKFRFVIHLLISTCLAASFWGFITDPHEVTSTLEPLHQLVHGSPSGDLVTPSDSIHSFFQIGLFYPIVQLSNAMGGPKTSGYFMIRVACSLICSFSFIRLYQSVQKTQGNVVSIVYLMFLAFVPLVFVSAAELLPETLSMVASFFFLSALLDDRLTSGLVGLGFASLLGWPYTCMLGLPTVVYKMVNGECSRVVTTLTNVVLLTLFGVCIPSIMVDYSFHGKVVIPSINYIFQHNIKYVGMELYYFKRAVPMFNVSLILSLLSLPILFVHGKYFPDLRNKSLTPLLATPLFGLIFLTLFFPLREVRFLFPLLPFVVFAASVSLLRLQDLVGLCHSKLVFLASNMSLIAVVLHVLLGLAQIAGIYYSGSAPTNGVMSLNVLPHSPQLAQKGHIRFCMENHRHFPSNFIFPANNWTVVFSPSSSSACHFVGGLDSWDILSSCLGSPDWSVYFNSSMTIFDKSDSILLTYAPWFVRHRSANFLILQTTNFDLVE